MYVITGSIYDDAYEEDSIKRSKIHFPILGRNYSLTIH